MTSDQVIASCRQTDAPLSADLPKAAVAAVSSAPLLSIKGLSVRFGGIVALDNVSFDVKARQICGLIGPNGAGKTTLFNCVSRLYQPCTGSIHFAGERLLLLPRHRLARLGIGRTFQNLALFQTMSARDNVLVGGHCRSRGGFVANALRLPTVSCEERLLNQRASDLLQMLHLASVADLPVSVLPFWSRKRVELARALASEPKLLLLDEPAAGLNHAELEELGELIVSIRNRLGTTILHIALELADHAYLIETGCIVMGGSPAIIARDDATRRAYLGY
jgi:branched-chain amino acid transport system ATP-binding protein